ncbi:MAG: 2Fe-2S iron-sulfur cluster-binding protein [Burkholderiales bacterium]
MAQLLTLSRAARLMGMTRGVLQKRIRDGDLPSHDGMVSTEDLLIAFPGAHLADDAIFERITRIKEEAFGRRVRERVLPEREILAERLYEQSLELADVRSHLQRYHSLVVALQTRLREVHTAPLGTAERAIEELDSWIENELRRILAETTVPDSLALMDDMLKLVSAHVIVQPSRRDFFVEGAETILEAALRAGLSLNYGCSVGNCGLCKARVVSGQVKKVRHHDYVLSEAERLQGHALMCCHTAVSDVVIEALEAAAPGDIPQQQITARVKSVTPLSEDVCLLHLQTPRTSRLRFLAGQGVTLGLAGAGESELYIASCPCDDRNVQFHVVRDAQSAFAERVFAGLDAGENVTIWGPWGDLVLREDSLRSLVFVAGDEGFAPLKSLIEHAMALDTAEALRIYWHASRPGGHYLANLCRAWSEAFDNVRYAALAGDVGEFAQRIMAECAELKDCDVYLAGSQPFVDQVGERLRAGSLPARRIAAIAV